MGESGSGKDTIAEILRLDFGLTSLISYTTRPPRYKGENTHIFITDEEFVKLKNIVAYTEFNGYKYCATSEQVDNNDVYVIDPDGVIFFKECYKGDKEVFVVYLRVGMLTRFWRMIKRGDGIKAAWNRIKYDKEKFLFAQDVADIVLENKNAKNTAIEILKLLHTTY